jgi:hypothetical protein
MSSPAPLIVPAEVSALVLNDTTVTMLRSEMAYDQLAKMLSPAPAPFSATETDFATDVSHHGVYLMWTLPPGLRRQRRAPAGALGEFPFVPNRWLVVRLLRVPGQPPGQPAQVTSWVVSGDAIDNDNGRSAYIDPGSADEISPTRIGIKTPIGPAAPWREPADQPPPYFLRAVAEANPAFAAFQPFNQNVFSIFDDLSKQGPATVSYYVLGWYHDPRADPPADPLREGRALEDILGDLGWSVPPGRKQDAAGSVFQGAVFGVPWPGEGRAPRSRKDNVTPSVAIGSNTVDASIAFARAALGNGHVQVPGLGPDDMARLLEVFAYDLVPLAGQPGVEEMLEEQIRRHWFSSSAADSTWTITDAAQDAAHLDGDAADLRSLNESQSRLDEARRALTGVQRELFAMWCKKAMAQAYNDDSLTDQAWPWGVDGPSQFDAAIERLTSEAASQVKAISALQDAVTSLTGQLSSASARLLKQVPGPSFWAPVDPVAVVSDTAHLMRLDPNAQTECRWSGELVTAVQFGPAGGTTLSVTAEQVAGVLAPVPWASLPDFSQGLIAELFLLDPANADYLAAAAGRTLPPGPPKPSVVPGYGTAPAADFTWSQPWRPIYFDWQIQWYPIPFRALDKSANWTFDGLDYRLASTPAQKVTPTKITGRTLLTAQPAFQFRSLIKKYLDDNPASPISDALRDTENAIEQVDGWDVLSQSLSGLGITLAGWNPIPVPLPPSSSGTRALFGDQAAYPPASLLSESDYTIPPSTFEGMRAGQFYIERVTVVDVFGQVLEIVQAPEAHPTVPGNASPHLPGGAVFTPLIADGLVPDEPLLPSFRGQLIQLPPRILQPARLNLDLLGDREGNPVIGWLLPNHLDSSIAVYGPDGSGYGALRLGPGGSSVWDAAPGSPWSAFPPPAAQGDLPDLVVALQAKGAAALRDFVQAVDESLWTVDPLGTRPDALVSALIGRPLAVVSAAVWLELQTAPWRDMAWPYTFKDPPPQPLMFGYEFPVRLGDLGHRQDGLLGYYPRGAYDSFNCVHLPDRAADDPPLSGYLRPIGPDQGGPGKGPDNYVMAGFGQTGSGVKALTLIMDPRASVHARCGLVPAADVALPQQWVDGALAKMAITMRSGPVLARETAVTPARPGDPDRVVTFPGLPAKPGALTWLERDGDRWSEKALAAADGTAALSPVPLTLLEGLLRLVGEVQA